MFNSINQWMWDANEDLPWREPEGPWCAPVEQAHRSGGVDWPHVAETVAWVALLIAIWLVMVLGAVAIAR